MKVSLGGSLRHESARTWQWCFSIPTNSWVQKVQTNSIIAVKVHVSLPPISVLTTQTALTDWQNIIRRFPLLSQNVGAKRQKQPLRWLSTSHQNWVFLRKWNSKSCKNLNPNVLWLIKPSEWKWILICQYFTDNDICIIILFAQESKEITEFFAFPLIAALICRQHVLINLNENTCRSIKNYVNCNNVVI